MEDNTRITVESLDKRMISWKKSAIIWAIIIFIILIIIITVSVFYIANLSKEIQEAIVKSGNNGQTSLSIERNGLLSADYLAVIVPVFVSLIGSFIAFLGMNRLKSFDERIDQIRQEMQNDVAFRVSGEVSKDRDKYISDINENIKTQKDDFEQRIIEAKNELDLYQKESINKIEKQLSSFESKYGWVKKVVEESKHELDFNSVFEAHNLVEDLFINKPSGYVFTIKKIVERVCNEEISVNADDFHNLSAELARHKLYNEAYLVLKKANTIYTRNVDIIADMIYYASEGGMQNEANEAVSKLTKISYTFWTWRCYEFTCDYYRSIGDLEKALLYCSKAIEYIPNDEHGYRSKAEILMQQNLGEKGIQEAIQILNQAINRNVNCTQCANTLSGILLSEGQYEEALVASNRAIQELAQEQPSVDVVSVFVRRAMICDRIFIKQLENGKSDILYADKALSDYKYVIHLVNNNLGNISSTVLRQVLNRIAYISQLIDVDEKQC